MHARERHSWVERQDAPVGARVLGAYSERAAPVGRDGEIELERVDAVEPEEPVEVPAQVRVQARQVLELEHLAHELLVER